MKTEEERRAIMAGVTMPSFRCVRCRQTKRTTGRKPVVPGYVKAGYMCAACAAGRTDEPA